MLDYGLLVPMYSNLKYVPGTLYAQQSYKLNYAVPFEWIDKKWTEGFYATSMATTGSRLAVFILQCYTYRLGRCIPHCMLLCVRIAHVNHVCIQLHKLV